MEDNDKKLHFKEQPVEHFNRELVSSKWADNYEGTYEVIELGWIADKVEEDPELSEDNQQQPEVEIEINHNHWPKDT